MLVTSKVMSLIHVPWPTDWSRSVCRLRRIFCFLFIDLCSHGKWKLPKGVPSFISQPLSLFWTWYVVLLPIPYPPPLHACPLSCDCVSSQGEWDYCLALGNMEPLPLEVWFPYLVMWDSATWFALANKMLVDMIQLKAWYVLVGVGLTSCPFVLAC